MKVKKKPLHERWTPSKYTASYDDIRAEFKAWTVFNGKTNKPQMNEAELVMHAFACGFYRGIGWANFKATQKDVGDE
jgi:hypothetical protein